jgi:hypothetical protein
MDDSNSGDKYNTCGHPRYAAGAYRPDGWVSSPEDDDGQADGVPADAAREGACRGDVCREDGQGMADRQEDGN